MSRKIQDRNFLVWEVYPSGGSGGQPDNVHVIFHCLSRHDLRPRSAPVGAGQAEAQKQVTEMTDAELLVLLESAREIS